METRTGIIYMFTNRLNGKQYIGQTINEDKRYHEHTHCKDPNSHIDRAIKKYGIENFKYEVLERYENLPIPLLKFKLDSDEFFYIALHWTIEPYGYNQTFGGDGHAGYKMSEETKQKIRQNRTPVHLNGELNGCFGKKCVNNGLRNLFVYENELDDYLSQGWKLGMKPQHKRDKAWNSGKQSGTVWVTNGKDSELIHKRELATYIAKGYYKGRTIALESIEKMKTTKSNKYDRNKQVKL